MVGKPQANRLPGEEHRHLFALFGRRAPDQERDGHPLGVLEPGGESGGKRALPEVQRFDLELLDQRRFADGMAFLRYEVPH